MNIMINEMNAQALSLLLEDMGEWMYDEETGSLLGYDITTEVEGEYLASVKPAIETSIIFGAPAYSIQDGNQILSYRTKKAAVKKLACILVRDFLRAVSAPGSDDYRVERKYWDNLVQDMLGILHSDTGVREFLKA